MRSNEVVQKSSQHHNAGVYRHAGKIYRVINGSYNSSDIAGEFYDYCGFDPETDDRVKGQNSAVCLQKK
jgi:hypothetical protein